MLIVGPYAHLQRATSIENSFRKVFFKVEKNMPHNSNYHIVAILYAGVNFPLHWYRSSNPRYYSISRSFTATMKHRLAKQMISLNSAPQLTLEHSQTWLETLKNPGFPISKCLFLVPFFQFKLVETLNPM